MYKTDLPNPNSGKNLVKMNDGALVLLYNPDNKNWGSRGVLWVSLSKGNGKTWSKRIDIETGDIKDECSYPAIIHSGDPLAVTYTKNRKKIVFWTAAREWISNHAEDSLQN